jgi:hypothetical protein
LYVTCTINVAVLIRITVGTRWVALLISLRNSVAASYSVTRLTRDFTSEPVFNRTHIAAAISVIVITIITNFSIGTYDSISAYATRTGTAAGGVAGTTLGVKPIITSLITIYYIISAKGVCAVGTAGIGCWIRVVRSIIALLSNIYRSISAGCGLTYACKAEATLTIIVNRASTSLRAAITRSSTVNISLVPVGIPVITWRSCFWSAPSGATISAYDVTIITFLLGIFYSISAHWESTVGPTFVTIIIVSVIALLVRI